MKKYLEVLSIVLFTCFALKPHKVFASGASGGELLYEWLSDSTYRFHFRYYHDCTAGTAPATLPLCFNNTCNNSSFTVTMGLFQTIAAPLINGCGYKTKCDSPSSTISAYATILYQATVTMPSQCSEWKMFTYVSGRNNVVNLQTPTLTDMYVEATLNNTGSFQGNSSPYFTVNAAIYPCANLGYLYNAGAVDIDGDSLVTEVVRPMTGVTNCNNTPIDAPFEFATPIYSIPQNPIQTGNAFSVNAVTGEINMIPKLSGTSTLTLRVKEYRNGILVGSVMREMPVNVMVCNPPVFNAKVGCEIGIGFTQPGFLGRSCVELPFSFCIEVISADTNAKIFLTDNHQVVMPGSSVTISGQNTDTVILHFSWAPGLNDYGNKNLTLMFTDNSCYYPGTMQVSTMSIPIYINQATKINASDTVVCLSKPIQLSVTGGGAFSWEIITAIDTTTVWGPTLLDTPLIPTRYIVTSNHTSYCPIHKDTVDAYVATIKNPVISIQALPDTIINAGEQVTFSVVNTNCNNPLYQWQLNGTDIQSAGSNTWVSNTLSDMDMVNCRITCNDTCSTDTTSNFVTIHVTNGVHHLQKLSGVELYPNPSSGTFIVAGYAREASTVSLMITNMIGQVAYTMNYKAGTGVFREVINVNTLPDGVYILRIETNDETLIKRFNIVR